MACKDVNDHIPEEMSEDFIEIPRDPEFSQWQRFNELRSREVLTDITIISEKKKFPCHRIILASSSSFFLRMFETPMESRESIQREVNLPTEPNVVKVILEYMYMGTVKVPSDLLAATIEAANYLGIPKLTEDCLQRANPVLYDKDVLVWYNIADLLSIEEQHQHSVVELRQHCSKVLERSLTLDTEGLDFQELSFKQLMSIYDEMRQLAVRESLVKSIFKWISHSHSHRQEASDLVLSMDSVPELKPAIIDFTYTNTNDFILDPSVPKFRTHSLVADSISLVVIAGREKKCWQVDDTLMNVIDFPTDFNSVLWYSCCEVPRGFIITGGLTTMMFIGSPQYWVQLTQLRGAREQHASLYLNHNVYILGGEVSGALSNTVHSLNLDYGSEWMDEPDLPKAISCPEIAAIELNIFLLDVNTNQLLCLDTNTRVWREKARCPGESCIGPRLLAVNGQLLVAGGNERLCARYTPVTDTWVTCQPPALQHHLGALVHYDKKIYLIGGGNSDEVEELNENTGVWSSECCWKMPKNMCNIHAVPVFEHEQTVLPERRLLQNSV